MCKNKILHVAVICVPMLSPSYMLCENVDKKSVRHAGFCLLMRNKHKFISVFSRIVSLNIKLWSKGNHHNRNWKFLLTVERQHMEMLWVESGIKEWLHFIICHTCYYLQVSCNLMHRNTLFGLSSVQQRQRKMWTVAPNSCRRNVPSHYCSTLGLLIRVPLWNDSPGLFQMKSWGSESHFQWCSPTSPTVVPSFFLRGFKHGPSVAGLCSDLIFSRIK